MSVLVLAVAVVNVPAVNVPAAAVEPPIITASAVPPLMSAVVSTALATVTTPVESAIDPAAVPSLAFKFVTSILVVSTVVALAVVNVPTAAEAPPITAPSIVPALMSIVLGTVPISMTAPLPFSV